MESVKLSGAVAMLAEAWATLAPHRPLGAPARSHSSLPADAHETRRDRPPGAAIHHPPHLPHATRTAAEPLLARCPWWVRS